MRLKPLIFLAILLGLTLVSKNSNSQLVLDFEMSPQDMAQNLVGEGVTIYSPILVAADSSYSYYYSNGIDNVLSPSEGVLLTTGKAYNALGPNDSSGLPDLDGSECHNCELFDNNFPGDALLNELNSPIGTFDACSFQFTVEPAGDNLRFEFTYASEEYEEWIGSPFNDIFGFFISGVDADGVAFENVNLAVIDSCGDDTIQEPVAVNSVNDVCNAGNYFGNIGGPVDVQYDGMTIDLVAEIDNLVPCTPYVVRLVIADGSDRLYDSAVFVNALSSDAASVETSTQGGTDNMIEGCNQGTLTFCLNEVAEEDTFLSFSLDGSTADLNTDYTTVPDITGSFDTDTELYSVLIPTGETCIDVDILSIADGIADDGEYLNISVLNALCAGTIFQDSVLFVINDELIVDVSPSTINTCGGIPLILEGTSSAFEDPLNVEWTENGVVINTTDSVITVNPTINTTYEFTNQVGDCIESETVTVTINDPTITFDVTNVPCTDGNTGEIDATVTGATGNIDYEWTSGGIVIANTQDITGLSAGTYTLTITDELGCSASESVTIIETGVLVITNVDYSNYTCSAISCNGACDGSITVTVDGGVGGYTYQWEDEFGAGVGGNSPTIDNLCAGDYTVTVFDEGGCEISLVLPLTEPDPLSITLVSTIDVLCTGEQTGQIEVIGTGGCSPYSYVWSHDPNLNTPVATDLPSGSFTVTVEDANGCTTSDSITIVIGEPTDPLDGTVDNVTVYPGGFNVSCPGAEDGTIDVTITGGVGSYDYLWTHQQSGTTYDTEDLTGLPCGDYILVVTDENNCTFELDVELTCVPEIQLTWTTVPNPCGDPDALLGEIALAGATGGHGGAYTYTWLSGPSCPCTGLTLTGLASGNYVVEVEDVLGCTEQFTINVGQNDLFDVTGSITNSECGNECSGSIEIDINPGASSTTWTYNGDFFSNDEDIFDLCPGTYEVTVQELDCIEVYVFEVDGPEPIEVEFTSVIPPACVGQNNGSITAEVSGGNGTLDIEWLANSGSPCFFDGSILPTINNLFECWYVIEVTDDLGCTYQDSIFLEAPQVMSIFVEVSEFDGGYNVSCPGANDGAISVTVSGGTPDCTLFSPFCYDYDWTGCDAVNIPGVPDQDELGPGSYCVVVTDANGCIAATEIDMLEPDTILSSGVISDVLCNGNCDGYIVPEVTGGSGTYGTYTWIQGDIGDNEADADTLFNLCPGIFELYVIDSNFCEDTVIFEIEEPEPIELTIDNITDVSCFGYSDGAVSVTATGGVSPYDYDWNDGQYNGNVLTGIPADTLELIVTDFNMCMDTTEIIVNQPDTFIVILNVPTLPDAEYTIPCSGDSTANIFKNIIGGVPTFDCVWSGPGIVDVNATDQLGMPAGTYDVVVTDNTGCEAYASTEITEPDQNFEVSSIVSSYPSGFEISCFGACDGFIGLTPTGGDAPYTFIWEIDESGDTLSFEEDQFELCPGYYEVLITDNNGCDTLISYQLEEPEEIVWDTSILTYDGGFNVSCFGVCDGELEISNVMGGVPGYTFDWQQGGTSIGTGTTVSNVCPEDVTLFITDEGECVVDSVYVLLEPDTLQTNPDINNISCEGLPGSIDANISGGSGTYEITWIPDLSDTEIITDLDEGTYCIEVVDSNGCEIDECWTLEVPEELTAEVTVTPAACGVCDGTISLDIAGGNPPYNIEWDGPTDIPDDETSPVDLCPGVYSVEITDTGDCELIIAEIIVESAGEFVFESAVTQPLCFGDCNGQIDITLTDAADPITIEWTLDGTFFSNSEDLSGLCNGTYEVSVIDGNDCSVIQSFIIDDPEPIDIEFTISNYPNGYNVSEFLGTDGSIDTDVSGGTPDLSYEWTGPTSIEDGTEDPIELTAGDYTLTITDANGCMADTTIILTQPEELTLPTGFSPNGDGDNDGYVILGLADYATNTFIVYNRWGNKVYEKNNYDNSWVGNNDAGEELPDGTYYIAFMSGNVEIGTFVDLRR